MELAVFVVASAPGSSALLQILFAGILGGGGVTAAAAWRRAKPEAELSTIQSMQIVLNETRLERDEARKERDEWEAKAEAHHAHSIYLERRIETLEARLRYGGLEVPETPRRGDVGDRRGDRDGEGS